MSYNAKVYRKQGGAEQVVASGGTLTVESGGVLAMASGSVLNDDSAVRNVRVRATAAEVNAAGGKTLVAALAGYKCRIVNFIMVAIGGNAATATSVDIVTTQAAASARPFVVAVAALTRSTPVGPTSANVTALADGAALIANDVNTAVAIEKQSGGGSLGTATHIDCILSYVMEKA